MALPRDDGFRLWLYPSCGSSVGGNAGMNARELTQNSAAQTHLRDPDHATSGLETCHVATSYSSPHDPSFDAAGRARPGGEHRTEERSVGTEGVGTCGSRCRTEPE